MKTIYVHWSNPPTCEPFLYQKVYDKTILYTPKDCIDNYRNVDSWKQFKNIKAGDYTGIYLLPANENTDKIDYDRPYQIFNLAGQLVCKELDQLPHGIYIIKQGGIINKIYK